MKRQLNTALIVVSVIAGSAESHDDAFVCEAEMDEAMYYLGRREGEDRQYRQARDEWRACTMKVSKEHKTCGNNHREGDRDYGEYSAYFSCSSHLSS